MERPGQSPTKALESRAGYPGTDATSQSRAAHPPAHCQPPERFRSPTRVREWVDSFGKIVFEKLAEKNMLRNHYLAKSISDAAWNQLIAYTTYKAENAGRVVVTVDPRNTSRQCSCCGTMVEKSLSVRVHTCPICGLSMDRDQNAAIKYVGIGATIPGHRPRSPCL